MSAKQKIFGSACAFSGLGILTPGVAMGMNHLYLESFPTVAEKAQPEGPVSNDQEQTKLRLVGGGVLLISFGGWLSLRKTKETEADAQDIPPIETWDMPSLLEVIAAEQARILREQGIDAPLLDDVPHAKETVTPVSINGVLAPKHPERLG